MLVMLMCISIRFSDGITKDTTLNSKIAHILRSSYTEPYTELIALG